MEELRATEILLERQRAAQMRDGVPGRALRRDRLARLRRMVTPHLDAFAAAIAADFGRRPAFETKLLEAHSLLAEISHAEHHLSRWMRPRRRRVDLIALPGRAELRYEPLGIIGILSPWNYPLLLTLGPLVGAFAAGNRALLKPSEASPAFTALLRRLVAEHFDPTELAVVEGGPAVAAAFCRLPFDHLVFTGSTAVGRKVMEAAASQLTPVTLELGGKSPAILCPSADLRAAALSIAYGKWINAGQTCIAPDYVLVPEAQAEAAAEALLAAARQFWPALADYTSLIDDRAYDRLFRAVTAAAAKGARVLWHGAEPNRQERIFPPAVVIDPPAESVLVQEEIFGPVLPLLRYRSLDEALAYVAARPHPLALYAFATEGAERRRVLDHSTSGGVTLNATLLHLAQSTLPFGGVGASGMGAYHGEDGFKAMSHARGVYEARVIDPLRWVRPPYRARTRFVLRQMLRRVG